MYLSPCCASDSWKRLRIILVFMADEDLSQVVEALMQRYVSISSFITYWTIFVSYTQVEKLFPGQWWLLHQTWHCNSVCGNILTIRHRLWQWLPESYRDTDGYGLFSFSPNSSKRYQSVSTKAFFVITGIPITAIDSVSGVCPHTAARLHSQYSTPVIPWILEDIAKLNTVLQPAHLDDNMAFMVVFTMAWSAVKAFSVQAEQVEWSHASDPSV